MNPKRILILWASILVIFIPLLAQTGDSSTAQKNSRPAPTSASDAQAASHGEKVFQQNCSRCHNAPQGFSTQISATILRHMRVRASLSARDERDLLRFMNP